MSKPDVCPSCRGSGVITVRTADIKTGTYTLTSATCRDCGTGRRTT